MLLQIVPAVASQMVTLVYNLADTYFVGMLNAPHETSAVTVAYPSFLMLTAISNLFGVGGASAIARALGRQDEEGARRIAAVSLAGGLLSALLFSAAFRLLADPVLHLCGATEATYAAAYGYAKWVVILGGPFTILNTLLANLVRAEGGAGAAAFGVSFGGVLNILLDPLFIFVFHMGVKGAALATILSQAVSAVWVVSFLCSGRSGLHIRREHLGFRPRVMGKIAALGVAPFIMQSTESLVTVVLNVGAQKYGGDLYVTSITILQSVMQVIGMPSHGITTGVQPIMSYNYGAKNYARVRAVFRRLLAVTMTVTTAAFLLVALFPAAVALMFNDDPQLVTLVGRVMPLFFGGVWAFGAQVACQSTFMALGQAKTSLFLALLRKIILLVPLAVLLPWLSGSVMGLYAAEPVADFLASATTLILFLKRRKTLLPLKTQEED